MAAGKIPRRIPRRTLEIDRTKNSRPRQSSSGPKACPRWSRQDCRFGLCLAGKPQSNSKGTQKVCPLPRQKARRLSWRMLAYVHDELGIGFDAYLTTFRKTRMNGRRHKAVDVSRHEHAGFHIAAWQQRPVECISMADRHAVYRTLPYCSLRSGRAASGAFIDLVSTRSADWKYRGGQCDRSGFG